MQNNSFHKISNRHRYRLVYYRGFEIEIYYSNDFVKITGCDAYYSTEKAATRVIDTYLKRNPEHVFEKKTIITPFERPAAVYGNRQFS